MTGQDNEAAHLSVAAAIFAVLKLPQARSDWLARGYALGVALFAAGLVLRWCAIGYLGWLFTVDVAIAADHQLLESGPYRALRHPSYTGALLAFAGYGICLGNWISLAAVTLPIHAARRDWCRGCTRHDPSALTAENLMEVAAVGRVHLRG